MNLLKSLGIVAVFIGSIFTGYNMPETGIAETPRLILGGPSTSYQATLLPITDSAYDIGTTSREWRNFYVDRICLAGDCQTSWSAGSGAPFAWTPNAYGNSTSTVIAFLNGLLSTASSTFNGPLFITNLSQGLLYNGTNGRTMSTATGTVAAGTGISVTAGQSIVGSGLTITNDGVTSISATAPLVNNLSTGAISLTCPTCSIFSFTASTNYGLNGQSTTTFMSFVNGLAASSTSYFVNLNSIDATTTNTFTLPVKAALVTPVTGNVGADSTTGQLRYSSVTGTTRVLDPNISSAFLFATSSLGTGTTTLKVSGYANGTTFASFGCSSSGSGTFTAQLGDSNASSTFVVSGTGLTTSFTTLSSNNTFTAGETVWYSIGSVVGTVVNPTCSYSRTITAD